MPKALEVSGFRRRKKWLPSCRSKFYCHCSGKGLIYNNIGVALARLGRYETAFEAFKTAGGEARAHNNMGCIYMEKGEYAVAVAHFEKATMALDPSYYLTASENLKKVTGQN